MKRYEPRTPKTALAVAAAAMTVLTLGVFVAAPTFVDAPPADRTVLARSAPAPVEVRITPSRIDVIGVREKTMAAGQSDGAPRQTGKGG